MMKKTAYLATVTAGLVTFGAAAAANTVETVILQNHAGEDVGTVTLTGRGEEGVLVHLEASGLTPGAHGFHVHEKGDCTPADSFTNAGGHFNPDKDMHGFLHDDDYHAGDMPNIYVDESGNVTSEIFNEQISLTKGEDGYLHDEDGSAFIIHDGSDDYKTQSSGDAGERVACGALMKK